MTDISWEGLRREQGVQCPYCAETFVVSLDASGGSRQYVEDCPVCCSPILLRVMIDVHGELTEINLSREND